MRLWNKLAQDIRVIWLLICVCLIQFLIIFGLIIALWSIPTRFTFHIPPDLSNGATLKAGKVPNAYVGNFAYYIWQLINYWPKNGRTDSVKNLQMYGAYLTPEFRYQLKSLYKKLNDSGEIQGRVRKLEPVSGDLPKVTKTGPNTWRVLLKVRESSYVNGVLIKDKDIEYPIKVVRYSGNAQLNPFGLSLDGFFTNPIVLKLMK